MSRDARRPAGTRIDRVRQRRHARAQTGQARDTQRSTGPGSGAMDVDVAIQTTHLVEDEEQVRLANFPIRSMRGEAGTLATVATTALRQNVRALEGKPGCPVHLDPETRRHPS